MTGRRRTRDPVRSLIFQEVTMKRIVAFSAVVLVCIGTTLVVAGEPAPAQVKALAQGKLSALGSDPVIVAAVKAENAKGKTLAQIKARDEEWQKTAGVDAGMKALMDGECGKYLRKLQAELGYLAETFVMDNQGANVAMSDKTSDYWQGDEPKFTESYAAGKGAVHVSDVKFDDSSQTYVVQVSVPVRDGNTVIGAITFGVDVDKVK
jgi:hypothetical protein